MQIHGKFPHWVTDRESASLFIVVGKCNESLFKEYYTVIWHQFKTYKPDAVIQSGNLSLTQNPDINTEKFLFSNTNFFFLPMLLACFF